MYIFLAKQSKNFGFESSRKKALQRIILAFAAVWLTTILLLMGVNFAFLYLSQTGVKNISETYRVHDLIYPLFVLSSIQYLLCEKFTIVISALIELKFGDVDAVSAVPETIIADKMYARPSERDIASAFIL